MIKMLSKLLTKNTTGTVIGMVALLATFGIFYYTEYLKEREITVSIVNVSNVLNLRTPIPELQVLYENVDLTKTEFELRVYSIEITNSGDVDIASADFGGSFWGLRVHNGKILKVESHTGSSLNLNESISIKLASQTEIQINPIIFNKGEFFRFDFLLLKEKSQEVQIRPFGRILGLRDFNFISSLSSPVPSFLSETFKGRIEVQLARTFTYFFVAILFFFLVGAAGNLISKFVAINARRKRRHVIQSLALPVSMKPNFVPAVRSIYVEFGVNGLESALNFTRDQEAVNKRFKFFRAKNILSLKEGENSLTVFDPEFTFLTGLSLESKFQIAKILLEAGIVSVDEENVELKEPLFASAVSDLLASKLLD